MKTKQPMVLSVLLAVAVALVVAGCGEATVKVQTGERVMCTYGELVSSTVKTVEVPASKAADYKVTTKTVTCDKHLAIESLYGAAQAAIEAGDLKTARAKLGEVLGLDANFRKAAEQVAQIDAGKKPAPDTGTGGTGTTPPVTPPGGGIPEGPVASMASWVPDALAGYKADAVEADTISLTRQYVPTATKPVSSIVIVAEQYKDAAAAAGAAANTIARQYSTGRATVNVKGRSLLFGTLSKQFAAVAWNEGGVLVVIEAYAPTGGTTALKDELSAIAAALIK